MQLAGDASVLRVPSAGTHPIGQEAERKAVKEGFYESEYAPAPRFWEVLPGTDGSPGPDLSRSEWLVEGHMTS